MPFIIKQLILPEASSLLKISSKFVQAGRQVKEIRLYIQLYDALFQKPI